MSDELRQKLADNEQRKCDFPMFRGAVTGRLVTCGVCQHCMEAERIRNGTTKGPRMSDRYELFKVEPCPQGIAAPTWCRGGENTSMNAKTCVTCHHGDGSRRVPTGRIVERTPKRVAGTNLGVFVEVTDDAE